MMLRRSFSSSSPAKNALPFTGLKVLEFAGLAPGPHAGIVLADFGADVVRVDRVGTTFNRDQLIRNKRSVSVNAKTEGGRAVLRKLVAQADVIIDPFRPGVLERMGLGPKECEELSGGRVILARLTGYRRAGTYANLAGHDLNYIALSGILSTIKPPNSAPVPPNNYLGDFAGGGLTCAMGIMAALFERSVSGKGQVVESDMVTGTRYLATGPILRGRTDNGLGPGWSFPPGENILDGGCPYYGVYECSDGKYITVGALEPHFYAIFIKYLTQNAPANVSTGSFLPTVESQLDRTLWPTLRSYIGECFSSKTRDEWAAIYDSGPAGDGCVAPLLTLKEVGPDGEALSELSEGANPDWTEQGGIPEPAPKLSRTPGRSSKEWYATRPGVKGYFLTPGSNTLEVLGEAGYSKQEIEKLIEQKDVATA